MRVRADGKTLWLDWEREEREELGLGRTLMLCALLWCTCFLHLAVSLPEERFDGGGGERMRRWQTEERSRGGGGFCGAAAAARSAHERVVRIPSSDGDRGRDRCDVGLRRRHPHLKGAFACPHRHARRGRPTRASGSEGCDSAASANLSVIRVPKQPPKRPQQLSGHQAPRWVVGLVPRLQAPSRAQLAPPKIPRRQAKGY